MQAVQNSHLIGDRSRGLTEEEDESYGPKTTVWHVATDVIRKASGAPVWKFIELKIKNQRKLTKAEMIEILNRINIAGSTVSDSDTVAEIRGQKKETKARTTLIINLNYVPNFDFGQAVRTLFTVKIPSDLNATITYQDHLGQIFVRELELAG